jgi:hypothetical protein
VLLAYTFGQGFAAVTLAVFLFVWALVAVRIIRRDDLSALGKAVWIVAILVVPLVGLLVYFIWDAAKHRTA